MKKYLTSLLALSLLASGLANLKSNEVLAFFNSNDFNYQKNLKTIKIYNVDKEGQKTLSKVNDYTVDSKGNPITIIVSKANYDTGELTLIPASKSEYAYDENDNKISQKYYTYVSETSDYEISSEYIYTYNEAGLILTQDLYRYNEGVKSEKSSDSFTYLYDVNNNLLEERNITESGDNSKSVYEYNEKNLKIKEQFYTGDDFEINYEISYEYDVNNNVIKEIEYDYDSEGICSNTACTYKYDVNNILLESVLISYTPYTTVQTVPESYSKTEYSYNGDEVTKIESRKNTGEEYVLRYKNVTIDTDTLYQTLKYEYNPSVEGGWSYRNGSNKREITLDGSNVTSYTTYTFDESKGFYVSMIYEYEFYKSSDASNNFPYWVIPVGGVVILAGVYVCGYFFLFEKGKLQGKFFNTIYNWFKNLLSKLSKKNA